MATKKKMLLSSAGTAAAGGGGGALDIDDVFSTYLYEGNGATQSIVNGIKLGGDTGGAISLQAQADGLEIPQSSDFNFGTGDFTCEAWIYLEGTNSTYRTMLGFDTTGGLLFEVHTMKLDFGVRGTASNYSTSTLTADQWNHVAIVRSSGTAYWFINGTLDKTDASTYSSTDFSNATAALIGDYQKNTTNFDGSISNLRVSNVARYTSSFTPSTTPLTSDSSTVLLIGQNPDPFVDNSSSSHSASAYGSPAKSGVGPFTATDSGEGGLVWIKSRTEGTYGGHALYDTERGSTNPNNVLSTSGDSGVSATAAQYTSSPSTSDLTSFNSNGFSLGPDNYFTKNTNGEDYASWTFRKAPKFFTCLTYSGTGSAQNISHDLGSVPGMIIVKQTDATNNWMVQHRAFGGSHRLQLNSTDAAGTTSSVWNNTDPTSTVFTVGAHTSTNASGGTYVAYLFAHNDGDGTFGPDGDADVIKCGSYTGNGSGNGPEIDLGFEPQWVMIKNTTNAKNWYIFDSMRGMTVGGNNASPVDQELYADNSGSEQSFNRIAPTPNGFKLEYADGTQTNGSGNNYIYMAIRRGPLAVPEDATEVFAIDDRTATIPTFTSNFPVDWAISRDTRSGFNWYSASRLTGDNLLQTNTTDAQFAGGSAWGTWDHMDGWNGLGSSNSTYYSWMWKRAPGYFDAVAYSGNSTAGHTVSHNLGVVPEMMWIKSRNNTRSWRVYHSSFSNGSLSLNSSAAKDTSTNYFSTPTADNIILGTDNDTNRAYDYIAYLFASAPGVSKVGSFSHTTGSTTDVDCGFSSGARFVLWKSTNYANAWAVFDTARGIVSGNDPYVSLNNTNAEETAYDIIDPTSSGFQMTGVMATGNYIFYAIA